MNFKEYIPFKENYDPEENDWQIDFHFIDKVYKKCQLRNNECSMECIEDTIIALLEVLGEQQGGEMSKV